VQNTTKGETSSDGLYLRKFTSKMDSQNAQKSWTLANNIESVSSADEIYRFDQKQQQDILTAKPWEKEYVGSYIFRLVSLCFMFAALLYRIFSDRKKDCDSNSTDSNFSRLSRPSDETINRGPVCVRIQNIKHAL
jgi:hypothetical protein